MAIISNFPGGDGGASPTLIRKTITENGTYRAYSDNADGYSQVTVDVSGGTVTAWKLRVGSATPIVFCDEVYGPMNSYSTDYIVPMLDDGTPAKLNLSQPFEICCRFKVGSNPGNNTSRNIWGASNSYYYCPMMEVRGNMIGYSVSTDGSTWGYNARAITPLGYSLPLDTWITAKMTWDGTALTAYANDGTNTYTETVENITPYYRPSYGFEFGGCNKSSYSIAGYGATVDLADTYLKQGSTILWGAQSVGNP